MALESDISPINFWEMTYREIIDLIAAKTRVHINKLKEKAIMDYRMADVITKSISSLIDKEAKVPTLPEAYEFLFKEEKKAQDNAKAKADMEIWKQRMVRFAENHNRKWGEKN